MIHHHERFGIAKYYLQLIGQFDQQKWLAYLLYKPNQDFVSISDFFHMAKSVVILVPTLADSALSP